jgi:2-amino-4-hydroxy-6-hydroxymethyldihydropteridine diphosphokinase
MTKLHEIYLGLGSNLGDREAVLLQAIDLIGERVGQVTRRSSFIETEPWGFESDNRFLNAVVCCETELTPRAVLQTTQQIERDLGKRKRHATKRQKEINYQDRPIDIDILLYDDLIVDEPDLKIPHPLMHQREFVMRPLNEIREPHSL